MSKHRRQRPQSDKYFRQLERAELGSGPLEQSGRQGRNMVPVVASRSRQSVQQVVPAAVCLDGDHLEPVWLASDLLRIALANDATHCFVDPSQLVAEGPESSKVGWTI